MDRYMAEEGLGPNLAVVSTARRTQETWELARPAFVETIAQHDERRIYQASDNAILAVIHETAPGTDELLVVGHNPGLHNLALDLIDTASRSDLARLQIPDSRTGRYRLRRRKMGPGLRGWRPPGKIQTPKSGG